MHVSCNWDRCRLSFVSAPKRRTLPGRSLWMSSFSAPFPRQARHGDIARWNVTMLWKVRCRLSFHLLKTDLRNPLSSSNTISRSTFITRLFPCTAREKIFVRLLCRAHMVNALLTGKSTVLFYIDSLLVAYFNALTISLHGRRKYIRTPPMLGLCSQRAVWRGCYVMCCNDRLLLAYLHVHHLTWTKKIHNHLVCILSLGY